MILVRCENSILGRAITACLPRRNQLFVYHPRHCPLSGIFTHVPSSLFHFSSTCPSSIFPCCPLLIAISVRPNFISSAQHDKTTPELKTSKARDSNSSINKMQKQEVRGEEKIIAENAEKGGLGNGLEKQEERNNEEENPLPLMALNHVSRLCRNVKDSIEFYTKVLGFVLMERPQVLDFEGAWLFNYGVGIHLVQSKEEERLPSDADELDPQNNHISFQCEDMEEMEKKLKEVNVKYMKRTLEEDGKAMDQLFFNDPDGFMVEICNCENLKLVPAGPLGKLKLPMDRHTPPVETNQNDRA